MEIAEVQDRESLERYLDALPEDERREVALRVAYRAAARVLPVALRFFAEDPKGKRDLTALPVFGAVTVTGVAFLAPTPVTAFAASTFAAAFAASAFSTFAASTFTAAFAASAFTAAASFAASAAHAAADAAAAFAADLWPFIRADLERTVAGPLWPEEMPSKLAQDWTAAKTALQADETADWSFWIAWYDRVLAGRDTLPDTLAPIFNRLTKDDWDKGPAHINPMFDDVLAMYRADDVAEDTKATKLSKASYFDFIDVGRTMRAVAFPSDHQAFDDDTARNAFLKDLHDLRLALEDWAELARAQLQGRNAPVTIVVAIEQMLNQLNDIEAVKDVSLRDLVRKGSTARRLARSDGLQDDLGADLNEILKENLDTYSEFARTHLGDILAALDALRALELGDLDSKEVLDSLKRGVARLGRHDADSLLPPDARTHAIFNDMIADLEDEQSEINEATTDAARQQRRKRFAERFGGVSATFGRYLEKGSQLTNKGAEKFDSTVKWFRRWQTIEKIIEWWDKLPPPPGG